LWHLLELSLPFPETFTSSKPGKKDCLLEAITTHFVIPWAHIHPLGEYDFSDEELEDSVEILPPKLAA
jgi:hypothetical protein